MPQLIKTKINPIRKLVFLTFSDGSSFPISLDDHLRHLSTANLPSASLSFLLQNYALRQLALSPRSEKVLRLKLRRHYYLLTRRYRYFSPPSVDEIVPAVLQKIKSLNLIDPTSYIEHLIHRHSDKSARHLIYLLRQSGVSPSDLSPYLSSLSRADSEKVKRLVARKSNLSPNKLYPWLIRKGFPQDLVKTIIDETFQNR